MVEKVKKSYLACLLVQNSNFLPLESGLFFLAQLIVVILQGHVEALMIWGLVYVRFEKHKVSKTLVAIFTRN
jgi:hypothetical protein